MIKPYSDFGVHCKPISVMIHSAFAIQLKRIYDNHEACHTTRTYHAK